MNEGFVLASKVLKRQITLEEGVVGAVARDQLASFANSFNAIVGRSVLSRYQCEAMVSSRAFPSLEQLLEASEVQAVEQAGDLTLEEIHPAGEPAPEAPPAPDAPATDAPPAAEVQEGAPAADEQPFQMLDLHAVETLLKPKLDELEVLKTSQEDLKHAISRLEWFAAHPTSEASLPPGLVSLSFLLVFVILGAFLFFQRRPILALAILVPVTVLAGFMLYYEVSSARASARERQRQSERRQKEAAVKREQLSQLDQQVEAKLREIDILRAHLKIG